MKTNTAKAEGRVATKSTSKTQTSSNNNSNKAGGTKPSAPFKVWKSKQQKTQKKKKQQQSAGATASKQIKVIVNLSKCSSNWSNLATKLPARVPFKRQDAKKTPLEPQQPPQVVEEEEEVRTESKPIWFDVDKQLLVDVDTKEKTSSDDTSTTSTTTAARLTKALAMDCEMVGVGENGQDSILARVSLVNQQCECVYDRHVMPTERVTDYRTSVSGIRPADLKRSNPNAIAFSQACKEVAELIDGRLLVGHAIQNDLRVLFLSHPKAKTRDTQKCKLLRRKYPALGGLVSLKNLAKHVLDVAIQEGEHDSIVDAQVTMRIYMMFRKEWEEEKRTRGGIDKKTNKTTTHNNKQGEELIVRNGREVARGHCVPTDAIKSGNDTHKRYLLNKLNKRNKSLAKLKFLNK